MSDMINYLTTKNRLLVAMLAFILPFSFAKAEVKEDGKTGQQGWYVGIERVECLSVSLLSQVSDTTRRILVGLLAYMVAIVSTPSSRQSYLPSMER